MTNFKSQVSNVAFKLGKAMAKTDTTLTASELLYAFAREKYGTGDNSETTFAYSTEFTPIFDGIVRITDGVENFTDTGGTGTLTGDLGGTGTINYTSGAISITFNTAPTLDTKIFIEYKFQVNHGFFAVYKSENDISDYELIEITGVNDAGSYKYNVNRAIATGGTSYRSGTMGLTDTTISDLDLRVRHPELSVLHLVSTQYNQTITMVEDTVERTAVASLCEVGDIIIQRDSLAFYVCQTAGSLESLPTVGGVSAFKKSGESQITGVVELEEDTTQGLTLTQAGQVITVSNSDSSETQKGVVELATDTETQTGTDDTKAITPLKLDNALDEYFTSFRIGFPKIRVQFGSDFNFGGGGVAGSHTENSGSFKLNTAGDSNSYMQSTDPIFGTFASAWFFDTSIFKNASGHSFYGIYSSETIDLTNSTCTDIHCGFIIDGSALYASNADGTTQTKTTISGITTTVINLYQIVYTPTEIKFYVNGALEATHTTNLPTGYMYIAYYIKGDSNGLTSSYPYLEIDL